MLRTNLPVISLTLMAYIWGRYEAMETWSVMSQIKPYQASFNVTFEDFVSTWPDYKYSSPILQSTTEIGMKWQIETKRESHFDNIEWSLRLLSLPEHVSSITVSCYTSTMNEAKKEMTQEKILTPGGSLKFYIKIVEMKNSHYVKITFHIKGVLRISKVIKSDVPDRAHQVNYDRLFCAENVALDTLKRLKLNNDNIKSDFVLKSRGKEFKCHKVILNARSQNITDNFVFDEYDFSEQMTPEELDDFVSFMYTGKLTRQLETCRALYVVAIKYKIPCLEHFCEDVLSTKINGNTAKDFFKFGEDHKSNRLMTEAAYCLYNQDSPRCIS